MQTESPISTETTSFRQTPEERAAAYENLSEDGKKIAQALDHHLNEDIMFFEGNNVMIRIRLGNKIIAEYPIHCEIKDNEVLIYEYAKPKSN